MKTLLTTLCLTFAVLLGSVGMSWSGDYQKGVTAYERGDYATALREWTPLAEQGDADAQYNLGMMYNKGKGVPQDDKTAVKWFRLAAKQGNAKSQYNLGTSFLIGRGVPQNYKTALKWYRLAAEQGLANAQYNLGTSFFIGAGVPQNYKTALKWYRLAAKQGSVYAQTALGLMYDGSSLQDDNGNILFNGVRQDNKTAVKWYTLAAEQGHADAQNYLGVMYHKGKGVTQDYKTAVKWYTLAAKQGVAYAQNYLGIMYEEGKGVPKDDKTAVKWYTLAAKQGDANAKTNLSNLQKILERTNFFDTQTVTAKKSPPPKSAAEKELAELRREVARLKKENKSKPKQVAKQKPEPKVVVTKSSKPYVLQFKKVAERPDDIAVIIANSNYTKQGKDIPNVDPAYNDGENIKKYFMDAKGIREGNIIYLKDATGAQLTEVFGNERNYKANLFNWVKPNKSKVYVYYVGHGAPASNDGSAFLVPVDSKSQTIEFSGYPLDNLYRNLGKIKARSVTVILEACFSGVSQAGMLLPRSSGITIVAKASKVPANVKVISAGSADQMASWEKDESQSLFTKYFLRAMSGEGDKNKDGKVDDTELQNYLDGTMTYFARRYYGRDQKVQITLGR